MGSVDSGRFYVETLGCPKNQVDSDKLIGTLLADGMSPVDEAGDADLVVVNTCAFIEEARKESIDTILALAEERRPGARLVVTGCMAERYGAELAEELPEVDAVVGFGVPIAPERQRIPVSAAPLPTLDLLNQRIEFDAAVGIFEKVKILDPIFKTANEDRLHITRSTHPLELDLLAVLELRQFRSDEEKADGQKRQHPHRTQEDTEKRKQR
ncbi:MAG: hypothetical protein EBR65_02495, partial [Actinobacteria bacterium]|nr:hypothetical protein [Actinomycetota bacterium]